MLLDCLMRPNSANRSVTVKSPVVVNGSLLGMQSILCVAVGSAKDFILQSLSNFCTKAGNIVNTCQ